MIRTGLIYLLIEKCLDAVFSRIESNLNPLDIGKLYMGGSNQFQQIGDRSYFSSVVFDVSDCMSSYLSWDFSSKVTVMGMRVIYHGGVTVTRLRDGGKDFIRVLDYGNLTFAIRLNDSDDIEFAESHFKKERNYLYTSDDWIYFRSFMFPYMGLHSLDKVIA